MDSGSENSKENSLNLNSNVEARIKNPLAGIPRAQLVNDVEAFAKEKDLTDILPILTKGAICQLLTSTIIYFSFVPQLQKVAQNPLDFEKLDVLDDSERDIIRHEYAHRWSHPLALYVTIFVCSVGAAVQ
jgi:hypothetical protein